MATFDYQSYVIYTEVGNSGNFDIDTTPTGAVDEVSALNDNEGDTTFEVGDTFTNGGTFEGYFTEGTTTYMVVRVTNQQNKDVWHVYSDQSATDADTFLSANYPQISIGSPVTAGTAATCFLAGTMIATPDGEKAVEELSAGDMIVTAAGAARPVRWVGYQTVSTRFGPAERLRPVRIAAGALETGLPHSDLTVTADHALLVEGMLAHAGALENGTSITRVPLAEMGGSYTVYHIETERQELIVANGAVAESYVDNVDRTSFDNFAEFEALYGEQTPVEALALPRAMSTRQLPLALRKSLGLVDAA